MLGSSENSGLMNGPTSSSPPSQNGPTPPGRMNGSATHRGAEDPSRTSPSNGATLSRNSGNTDDSDTYNLCWKEFASNLGSFFR